MSAFTDKSKGLDCIRCGAPDAYSCHYSGQYQHLYGKGRGIKCHDIATAELCYNCDNLFYEGVSDQFESKQDKNLQFHHLIMLTNIRRIANGVIKL